MENKGKGFAIASLVLGIVAVVFAFIPYWHWVAIVAGVVGIVLAVLGKKQGQKGVATAGLVLSIIGLAFGVILQIACGSAESAAKELAEAINNFDYEGAVNDALANLTF